MSLEYITKTLAAQMLGLSERRVLELKIRQQETYNAETKRRQTVLAKADVEKLVAERTPGFTRLLPAPGEDSAPPPPAAALDTPPPAREHYTKAMFLTIAEAADYIRLPASWLLAGIKSGDLPAIDAGVREGGRWRVKRRDLDAIEGKRIEKA